MEHSAHGDDIQRELEMLLDLFHSNLILKEEYDRRNAELLSEKNASLPMVGSKSPATPQVKKEPPVDAVKKFKVILLGDSVGKTKFVTKLLAHRFETQSNPTIGVEVSEFNVETTKGQKIQFEIWDCAGQQKNRILCDGYYIGGQAALIFYSVDSKQSANHVHKWQIDFQRVCTHDAPIVVCGTKADLPEEEHCVSGDIENFPELKRVQPFMDPNPPLVPVVMEVSAKSNLNMYEPFIELARKLLYDPELEFKDKFPLPAPRKKFPTKNSVAVKLNEEHKVQITETPPEQRTSKSSLTQPSENSNPFSYSFREGFKQDTSNQYGTEKASYEITSGDRFMPFTSTTTTSFPSFANQQTQSSTLSLFETTVLQQNAPETSSKEFKCVVLGDTGVGKTTYIHQQKSRGHAPVQLEICGMKANIVKFLTNHGLVSFHVYEAQHNASFGSLSLTLALHGVQCAIVMFDVTNKESYQHIVQHRMNLHQVCKSDKIVIVGNKVDAKERQVKPMDIMIPREMGVQYYDLSAKSNYNFEKPFVYLMRNLLDDPNVNIVEAPELQVPEVVIDHHTLSQLARDNSNEQPIDNLDMDLVEQFEQLNMNQDLLPIHE
jgi:GTP-binding nuclear protein Ran